MIECEEGRLGGLMSADENFEEGCFGDMFGNEAEVDIQVKPDIEFKVDRNVWINEGVPVDESRYASCWPKRSEAPAAEESAPFATKELTLYQKDKHHSLWGHKIWNAAKYLSKKMEKNDIPVAGLSVLELGAGLGVPSAVAHQLGARVTVTTDYPDEDLLSILRKNVAANRRDDAPSSVVFEAKPLLWGNREHMEECLDLVGNGCGFDVLILSDIVFNHICHEDLLKTVAMCLSKDKRAAAYCAFSHHRPRKVDDDLSFFEKAKPYGLSWEKVDEEIYPLMFPDDPGPAEVRAPIHCFKLQHIFDDAGPPVDYNVDYDVVVQGTGLTETLLSAALSRHGLRVLHLDSETAYGGAFNTLDPAALVQFVTDKCRDGEVLRNVLVNPQPGEDTGAIDPGLAALREQPHLVRRFLVDAVPLMFLGRGELIATLVESEAARNMEFQNVDRVLLATFPAPTSTAGATMRLHRMPLSRSEVFASKEFSPMEMRRLMKFVKDVEATLAESEHATTTSTDTAAAMTSFAEAATADDKDFPGFLRRKYQLSSKSVNLLTMFGSLQQHVGQVPQAGATIGHSVVQPSVDLLRTFLTSVGRFGGDTPFLVANYGSAELPQNMCRMSAVWNATFILRRHVTHTWRTDRKAFVTMSNNQRIETKAVVTPAASSTPRVQLARCAMIVAKPVITWQMLREQLHDAPADETEEELRQQTVPIVLLAAGMKADGSGDSATLDDSDIIPIHIHQFGYATMQAPQGESVIIHLTADANKCSVEMLKSFSGKWIKSAGLSEEDVWFHAAFAIGDDVEQVNGSVTIGRGEETESTPQDHVFRVAPLMDSIDDGAYLREAKSIFEKVVAHCETFGFDPWSRVPFPGGANSNTATDAAVGSTVKPPPPFLPPPPEEIAAQTTMIGEHDSDAAILADATRQLELKQSEVSA
jgi:EEF1A N-terminal glycine/lysine methyltransferase